jgi:hypothetical protein
MDIERIAGLQPPSYDACSPPPPSYSDDEQFLEYRPLTPTNSISVLLLDSDTESAMSEDEEGWSWWECIALFAILLSVVAATLAGALVDAKEHHEGFGIPDLLPVRGG